MDAHSMVANAKRLAASPSVPVSDECAKQLLAQIIQGLDAMKTTNEYRSGASEDADGLEIRWITADFKTLLIQIECGGKGSILQKCLVSSRRYGGRRWDIPPEDAYSIAKVHPKHHAHFVALWSAFTEQHGWHQYKPVPMYLDNNTMELYISPKE